MKILSIKNKRFMWPILVLVILSFLIIPLKALLAESILFESIETVYDGDESVTIKWRTNVNTRGIIRFGVNSTDLEHYIAESSSKSLSRWHEVKISSLKPEATYYYILEANNGQENIKTFVRSFDTEDFDIVLDAPKLSNVEMINISATAAAIRWTTDVSATSYVEYGIGAEYKKKVQGGKRTTSHLAILTKLEPGTEYYVKVYSYNKDDKKSAEHYHTFTTLRQGSKNEGNLYTLNFMPNSPSDSRINVHSITFDFDTNNLASGYVNVSAENMKKQKYTLAYNTKHHLYLQDLVPGKCYNFDFDLSDIFRNRLKESYTFCTRREGETYDQTGSNEVVRTEYNLNGGQITSSGSLNYTDEEVLVLGTQFSYFTPITKLLKTNDSPKIYAIMNSQRHQIMTPESLCDYGLSFSNVKIVAWPEIAKYSEVRLIKSVNTERIYYLWRRQDGTTMKISIPTPSVFTSYPKNNWSDVVKISEHDVNAYPDVKLLRAEGSYDVYYLSEGKKHFVSDEVFASKGFSQNDILTVNQIHLDAIAGSEYYK